MADSIVGLYETHAVAWDQMRRESFIESVWMDPFLEHTAVASASVLDVGCGSAESMARYFIEHGHDVIRIDASPSLISLCKQRFPAQRWLVSDMREMSLDQRFDGIVAWHSFFHLDHEAQRRMFPIFRVHAKDSAMLHSIHIQDRGVTICSSNRR